MGKSRRKHSREFRTEAIQQAVESGRSVAAIARSRGITPNLPTR